MRLCLEVALTEVGIHSLLLDRHVGEVASRHLFDHQSSLLPRPGDRTLWSGCSSGEVAGIDFAGYCSQDCIERARGPRELFLSNRYHRRAVDPHDVCDER